VRTKFTRDAQADLVDIGDWIASDSPPHALRFVQALQAKCAAIAQMPLGFPLVPRYEHLGIRKRSHGRYLIFYRVSSDQIEILRVLHGARDYESLLFPD
jgi:toxin ParE1/3/4